MTHTKKAGPLSKAEIYYVEQNPESKTPEELAIEMKRSVQTIRKCIEEYGKKTKKMTVTTTKKMPIDDLMVKKERNGQIVATVMSQAASEYLDGQRPKLKSKKLNSSMHNPKGSK